MSSNSSNFRKVVVTVALLAWVYLGFILAQAIAIAIASILKALGVPLEALGESFFTTVANIFVYLLSLAIVIGIPWKLKRSGVTWQDIGLQRGPKPLDFVWPFGGAVVYIIIASIITVAAMYIFPSADYEQAQNIGFSALSNRWEYILAFVSLVIVAPVAEEILFRGYLLGKLKKYIPSWIAITLSAALFAVAHGQFNVALDTFALGIVLGALRVHTGSIWPSIFLHMLKNGVAFYFIFVDPMFL